MKKLLITASILVLGLMPFVATQATPAEDREAFRGYFKKTLSTVNDLGDLKDGVYALNADAKSQWEEIEEFPPYEIELDKGAQLWEKKFSNGKTFTDCFADDLANIRVKYPYHDDKTDSIVTLEGDINKCLTDNGEKPFKWKKGNIAAVSGYIAFAGRGQKITTDAKSEKETAWYNKGKNYFYAKRGQLNLACADCHVYNANRMIRGDLLSSALGHTTHFPVFRSKWGSLGTLHRRVAGCNKQVRAKPLKAQSDQYKALEYFLAVMSNDMELNGPGSRK